MNKVKVALLQFDVQLGQPMANLQKVTELINAAAARGAQLVALPELWTTGYALNQLSELVADTTTCLKRLQQFAAEKKIWVFAGSLLEQADEHFYNTAYVISATGDIIGHYRKTHLFSLMQEEQYFTQGDQLAVIDTPFGKIAPLICYDLRFPELTRQTAFQGAVISIVAAEWPHPRLRHWRILNQARAIENQGYIIAVNRIGTSGTTSFCGNSMVIDPWGEIIAEADEQEALIIAELDLAQIARVRNTIPCWQDRRTDLYS